MKQALCQTCLLLAVLLLPSLSVADPDTEGKAPDPSRLQAALWKYGELHDFKLEGFMRTSDNLHPITIRTRERIIQVEFGEQPLQIRIEIVPAGSVVKVRKASGKQWRTLSDKERLDPILDSDVTYEDLGVDVVRWTDVTPVGTDSIKGFSTWVYDARPNRASRYASARYWISQRYLAVMRVDAYDQKGHVIKRLEINGVQAVGKTYTIKEMMLATMIPGRDISRSRTWFEIRDAKRGSGLPKSGDEG